MPKIKNMRVVAVYCFVFLSVSILSFCFSNHRNDLFAKNYEVNQQNSDANQSSQLIQFNQDLVIFGQKKQKIADFKIAIADSQKKREVGLMNRKSLPKNFGMLFIFEKPQMVAMWMKNTLIPLDMIFIRDGKIVKIFNNAEPLSQKVISSDWEVNMVLEINGNLAKSLKIETGSQISF